LEKQFFRIKSFVLVLFSLINVSSGLKSAEKPGYFDSRIDLFCKEKSSLLGGLFLHENRKSTIQTLKKTENEFSS
jgi:hypothetical protein